MALNIKKYCTNEFDNDRPLRLEHRFLVLRKLGQGTYGKVQLALNKETNEEVAVKTIKKAKIENEEDMLRIRREIHIMSSLQHPHIIHIHEVFETRQKIVIVMQYASGGELYDYLGCHQTLPEDEARRIFRQIASAIYYCHKNQICHRDLKLENILLDEEGNAKIADFGLSNIFDDKRRMNTFCGSPLYASPEIVKGTPYKGPEVDCWSLGVLLYTLVYGTMPFDGRSFKELVSQISEGRYEEPIYRSNASSLIRWLLTPDISKRATIEDVCKDSWINENFDTPLIEVAENMALSVGLHQEKISATKACLEKISKNGQEKSIFKKAATQLEEKAGKFTSLLTKNFENIVKSNEAVTQKRKTNFYEQITNYDVRFILNKIISAVETSFKAEKLLNNLSNSKSNVATIYNVQKKEENAAEKIDSAYIIPIFEVTSTIPKERSKNLDCINKNSENSNMISRITSRTGNIKSINMNANQQQQTQEFISENSKNTQIASQSSRKVMNVPENRCKDPSTTNTFSSGETLLKNSQKSFYSLKIPEQLNSSKKDFQTGNQHDNPPSHHPSQRNKLGNNPCSQKQPNPFMRTKHHVLTLARLLSLNYEKIMRNSFRVPACKKKLPGKITIPPTFDPNNPPTTTKKAQEERKELLIFPTVSVSENKEKIEKKIEKIKKAALNKNLIIRSDSKTRIRIEKYIRSQVKRIQDMVLEEQRSLQASLEHLDEQSLRDMSEMYYCTYGSENTDSGIANAEDEEYFCFLCSKPNIEKGTSGILDSILESIKKGFIYTSNHLHIPRAKEHDKWGYSLNNMNLEFGSLTRCKSEIQFPHEYLNYISPNNKSDLSKRTYPKQVIQRNSVGNTNCFFTIPSLTTSNSSDLRILRSASDSAILQLSNNTFDVVKLNTESHDNEAENYNLFPHFLQQTQSNGCRYFETNDYNSQSSATDTTFINKSQILDKDDGIGDSNDSFQSYIETLENFENDSVITRSMSSHSYMNFTKDNCSTNQVLSKRFLNQSHLKQEYESEYDDLERGNTNRRKSIANILDSDSWIGTLDDENVYSQQTQKGRSLRRHNTISCLRRKSEVGEDLNHDNTCTEFENYLWNAYKEHLLQNNRNDSEYFSSPNLNYYSLDRKAKFKNRDSKSMDYINSDTTNDFISKEFSHLIYPDQESGEVSSKFKKVLKHSTITKNCSARPVSGLNRTKSLCTEFMTDSDREDIIERIRHERKLSNCNSKFNSNAPFMSNFLKDMEKTDQRRKKNVGSNRRRYSTSNLSQNKRNKSEYKKSFLQLLALKRIEEAEKELDKAPQNNLLNNEEDNSGSLLEALKTHGYKNVISQRFQDTEDDVLDTFQMKYLKSPRKLRAELARLNYMYYDPLPRYSLGPFEDNTYFSDDLDYTRSLLSGLPTTSYYDMPYDFRQQAKQSVYDWLDTTQIDEYINSLRSDTFYNSEESTPTPDMRRCCTHWGKETHRSFDNESTSESQDTIEDSSSNGTLSGCLRNKEINVSNDTNPTHDRFQTNLLYSDDEKQESVHDRIWRKSFYSRFNNRALSRKERLSFIKPELSESRLGFLNNTYSNLLKSGYDKSELLQRDGSNKSLHTKRLQKHSPSFDKFESRASIKKKGVKTISEKETALENGEPYSNKTSKKVCNTCQNEEPDH